MAEIIKLFLACYDDRLKNVIIMALFANAATSVHRPSPVLFTYLLSAPAHSCLAQACPKQALHDASIICCFF
jgi:hypothetical protein